ncbi:MAG: DUF3842 family protein [Lachnospiraceae bacterium]|jgi:hypothetical protein
MNILVIDGQGGGLGRQLIQELKETCANAEIVAVGTNSMATGAMLKAGAKLAATGENAVIVCSKKADVIVGPIGIVIADSMLGEITPAMAAAIGKSRAKRVLIPMNVCDNIIVGVSAQPVSAHVKDAVRIISDMA